MGVERLASFSLLLTPEGIKRKMELTYHFLHRKMNEYDILKMEIEVLREELGDECGE